VEPDTAERFLELRDALCAPRPLTQKTERNRLPTIGRGDLRCLGACRERDAPSDLRRNLPTNGATPS